MPSRHVRTQAAVVVVFAAVLLTAGCTTGTASAGPTAPASTVKAVEDPAQTPAPVETTPAVAPVVGQTFAKGQEPTNLPAGQSLYEVYDAKGDYTGAILIAAGQPLPETVKADIVAPVKTAFDAGTAINLAAISPDAEWTAEQTSVQTAVKQAATAGVVSAGKQTGRPIALVFPMYTGNGVM